MEGTNEKKNAGAFRIPLITCGGSYEDIMADLKELLEEERNGFKASGAGGAARGSIRNLESGIRKNYSEGSRPAQLKNARSH